MALTKTEKLLVESIKSMFAQDSKLGLVTTDDDKDLEIERGYQYLHEQINEMFEVKVAELTHSDGVSQAFHKVHNYKYLDDPTFAKAMEKEMTATAVPAEERQKALGFISTIIEELRVEQSEWNERDSGLNPAMDEIKEASQPEQPLEFQIHRRDGHRQERNIEKFKRGDASPGKPLSKNPQAD